MVDVHNAGTELLAENVSLRAVRKALTELWPTKLAEAFEALRVLPTEASRAVGYAAVVERRRLVDLLQKCVGCDSPCGERRQGAPRYLLTPWYLRSAAVRGVQPRFYRIPPSPLVRLGISSSRSGGSMQLVMSVLVPGDANPCPERLVGGGEAFDVHEL
jgi:hypothetical protein